jgi:nucleoside-diphosphate-sugar epimerase
VQSRLCVDVRDVAKAIVAAGTMSEAIGQRFIVSKEERVPSQEMAKALQAACRETGVGSADKITYDADFQGGAIPIGSREVEATEKLERILGVTIRPVQETISDMGRALLKEQT